MKPILHVIFHNNEFDQVKKVSYGLKKLFSEEYKVVITTDNVDIMASNTTIVNLNFGSIDDLNGVIEYLHKIAEDNEVEEVEVLNDTSECTTKLD